MQNNRVTPFTNWPSSGRGRGFALGRGQGLSWSSGGEERQVGASRQPDPGPDKSDCHLTGPSRLQGILAIDREDGEREEGEYSEKEGEVG